MRWTAARRLAVPLILLLAATPAVADEPAAPAGAAARAGVPDEPPALPPIPPVAPPTDLKEAIRSAEAVSRDLKDVLDRSGPRSAPAPAPAPAPPRPQPAAGPEREAMPYQAIAAFAEAGLAEVAERLEALDREKPADAREIRPILEERRRLIQDFRKEIEAHKAAEAPKVSPKREAEELEAELARARAALARAAKDPDSVLPEPFRASAGRPTDGALKEMKEALDAAQDDANVRKAALDRLRAEAEHKGAGPLAKLKDEREAARKRMEQFAAARVQAEAALAAAKAVEARGLARDRLLNLDWEARVASARLRAVDAAILVESQREPFAELRCRRMQAAWELAERTLERMQARYRDLAARQQTDLAREAAAEQARADHADDPLERYRGRRAAELLDLKSQLLKDERAVAARPAVPLEEQAALADRAAEDFAHLKALVEGGRSGALVAMRLNTSYRRTASERDRLVRQDQARAAEALARYENALTDLELDALNDARDDRAALDLLLEGLPAPRRPEALALAADFDAHRQAILADRRLALQRLADGADATLKQILRRLKILDEQHLFIRTHIFWVRDAAPVGPETLGLAREESRRVARAVLRLARAPADRTLWGRVSWEFTLACAGIVVLPLPLGLSRRALKRRAVAGSAPRADPTNPAAGA